MWSLFKNKRVAPAAVPTDTVIPLGCLDDIAIFRALILNLMFKFDEVLDPQRLRLSLEKLLDRDGWRKLGARLRLNDNGKLEYHVPESYDTKRPAIAFSHVDYSDTSISDHPLASRLPKPSKIPQVVGVPKEFQSLARREDGPKHIEDYLFNDEPQMSLHIISFSDTTLVSLSWPHTLMDAMGRKVLLGAWSLVLQGRDDEVLPFYGFDTDPLAQLGRHPTFPYKFADRIMTGWRLALFWLLFILELLWWPKEEARTVCLPAPFIQNLHEKTLQEVREDAPVSENKGDEKPVTFVSEGDVLLAWITRNIVLAHVDWRSNQTVHILNAMSLRTVLGKDLLPAGTAYLGNAVISLSTYLTVKDVLVKPLSYTAVAIRRSLMEVGTREQFEAMQALNIEVTQRRSAPIYGDTTMRLIWFSNWTKAYFFDLDFSAAVVNPSKQSLDVDAMRSNRIGKPSYVHVTGFSGSLPKRNNSTIMGKDADGNYWFNGTLRKGLWTGVEEKLRYAYDDS